MRVCSAKLRISGTHEQECMGPLAGSEVSTLVEVLLKDAVLHVQTAHIVLNPPAIDLRTWTMHSVFSLIRARRA